MLRRAAIALVLAAAGIMIVAPPAVASSCPPGQGPTPVPGGGVICIEVTDPGAPGGSGAPQPGTSGGGVDGCHREADNAVVDCVTEWGVWVAAHQCYAHEANVPPHHPAWGGNTDGAVWMCALIDDSSPQVLFWVPPGGPAGGPPDPATLAQTALGQLRLETANIQLAPGAPDPAVVGVETWMWLPDQQWRTLTRTVRAGGTSVTVVAEPDRVVWDMGPAEKTCFDAGRAWQPGMGDEAVTTCGYTYDQTSKSQVDGAFDVTAVIQYAVDWTCSGVCTSTSGSLGLVDAPAGVGAMRVVQRQTVVIQ